MRTSSILSMYALKTYMPFPGALYLNFSEVHNLCHCEVHWEFNSKCLLCCPLPGIFGTSRPTRGSPDSTATRDRTSTWSGTWLSRRRSATLMAILRVATGDRITFRIINVLLKTKGCIDYLNNIWWEDFQSRNENWRKSWKSELEMRGDATVAVSSSSTKYILVSINRLSYLSFLSPIRYKGDEVAPTRMSLLNYLLNVLLNCDWSAVCFVLGPPTVDVGRNIIQNKFILHFLIWINTTTHKFLL